MIKDYLVYLGCHGIPERCLVINGKRMSICARCFGCNIGHVLALMLFILNVTINPLIALALVGIMFIDWGLQEFLGIMSNKYRRLITGFLSGFGIGMLFWLGVAVVINKFI